MTILITGSTGLIGAALVCKFAADGHAVFAAARNVEKAKTMFARLENVRVVEWDVTRPAAFEIGSVGLKSVVIPSNVMNVGDRAFYNCHRLATVTLEGSAPDVGTEVFDGTPKLQRGLIRLVTRRPSSHIRLI